MTWFRPVSVLLLALSALAVCCRSTPASAEASRPAAQSADPMSYRIRIRAGGAAFAAVLPATPASLEFKSMLPLILDMRELNRNEKYAALPRRLPVQETAPGQIRAGDLMLYGSNTLVLFYESFPSSYRYTRLGQLTTAEGLKAALGTGSVSVTFELE